MAYFYKKITALIITLLFVTLLSFLAFSIIPGNAAQSKLGTEATQEQVEQLKKEMGLDQPLLTRYKHWFLNTLRGDFGESYIYGIPVKELVFQKIPIMIGLVLLSFTWIVLLSIPIGIFAANHRKGKIDALIQIVNQIVMSVPSFFVGMIITLLFGLGLHWFIPGAYVSFQEDKVGAIGYLIAPSIAIALPKSAMAIKMVRSAIIAQQDMEYTRTAYSRGNTKRQVLYHHILRNAMVPIITFLGMTIVDLVASTMIVEQVFSIPGLGTMLITSIANRDYPVVQCIVLIIATIVIFVNFFLDLLYGVLDPRIRIQK